MHHHPNRTNQRWRAWKVLLLALVTGSLLMAQSPTEKVSNSTPPTDTSGEEIEEELETTPPEDDNPPLAPSTPFIDSLSPSPATSPADHSKEQPKWEFRPGGSFQFKALHKNIFADADEDKELRFALRRVRLDLEVSSGNLRVETQVRVEAINRDLLLDQAALIWNLPNLSVSAGVQKKPFSMVALQDESSLPFIEQAPLYHSLLVNTTGYAGHDLGLLLQYHFDTSPIPLPISLSAGLFNGRQSREPVGGYQGQQYEEFEVGLQAKDFHVRLEGRPWGGRLMWGLGWAVKAAEDRSDAENFDLHLNSAYEAGLTVQLRPVWFLVEVSLGENHLGSDLNLIQAETAYFFNSVIGALWQHRSPTGPGLDVGIRVEALDPNWKTPNDAALQYTSGINLHWSQAMGLQLNYLILQPITKVLGADKQEHTVEAMWRVSF